METNLLTTAAEYQDRLNACAERQGEPAGYTITDYEDRTDSYADYVGFMVTGPDVTRARAWLVATLRKEQTTQLATFAGKHPLRSIVPQIIEVRPAYRIERVAGTDVRHEFSFVCTGRYSLSD
jgi:hypothetical protein